jgi:hypothetical protein
MLSPHVADTGSHIFFPGHQRKGREVGLHHNIGKALLPVTEFEIGEHSLGNVPAEEHIALWKAIFQPIEEVACGNALAPVNPFNIRGANLDILDLAFFHKAFDRRNIHQVFPSFLM